MQIQDNYKHLMTEIKNTYFSGQGAALKAVRRQMVLTYLAIGQHIVEYEQKGAEHAVYCSRLLESLSKDLSHELGKGFNRSNLIYIILYFLKYPYPSLLSHQLTWYEQSTLCVQIPNLPPNEAELRAELEQILLEQ